MVSIERYEPSAGWEAYFKDPLVDISLTDSKELWLVQLPPDQDPDYDGQEITLKLHHDGKLGRIENSSGKSYELVSYASQAPETTISVFQSSVSESKYVGNISRQVSLAHYPEPSELEEARSKRSARKRSTVGTSSYMTPIPSSRQRSRGSSRAMSGISHGSMMTQSNSKGQRSSLFDSGEASKQPKRKRATNDSNGSGGRSLQDSEGRRSGLSSLG